jgi:uncharacterized protein (DUF2249 family)
VPAQRGQVVVDIRSLAAEAKRPVVFGIVDTMVEHDCADDLLIVCEHEPAGLAYQLDLRRETRGMFSYEFSQRSDGAWVALVRRIPGR